MLDTLWGPEVADQEQQNGNGTGTAALAVSADDFSALEERIVRAVEMVKRERQARQAAEERAAQVEAKLEEQVPRIDQLEKELQGLKWEREQVRKRVERLLAQLDALEL